MRYIGIFLLVGCVSLAQTTKKPGTIVLEDFSTDRLNSFNSNDHLNQVYFGEDTDQTGGINTSLGFMRTTAGTATTNGCYTGCGHYYYIPFTYPYDYPHSHAQYWIKSGTWATTTNRLYMRLKCDQRVARSTTGGETIQFGTYVDNHVPSAGGGSNKGPHYYHEVNADMWAGHWSYIQLNATPQHQVGANPTTYTKGWYDPEWSRYFSYYNATVKDIHYFDGLETMYLDTQGVWSGSTCDLDYITLGTESTPAPDAYVSSLTGTYTGTGYTASWAAFKDNSYSYTYQVRYSTSQSVKTLGWSNASDGGTASHLGDFYPQVNWSSSSMGEAQVLYLAIRPNMRVLSASVSGTVRLGIHSLHSMATGDHVTVSGVCANANGSKTITVIDNTTISLDGTSGACSYSSGGTVTSAEENRNFSELLIGEELSVSGVAGPRLSGRLATSGRIF